MSEPIEFEDHEGVEVVHGETGEHDTPPEEHVEDRPTVDLSTPPPRMPRATGHIPDSPEALAARPPKLARAHFGASKNLPGEASLAGFVRRVHDQGITSACVLFAICAAAEVRLAKLGLDFPDAARLAPYVYARRLENSKPGELLEDAGCMPSYAMQAVAEEGIPPEHVWPFDPVKVNEEPPWDVEQSASAFHLADWYLIDTYGLSRVQDVCNAIAQGYPVVFGTSGVITEEFEYLERGHAPVGPAESPKPGGHMMCILGYRTNANGQIEFQVLNSWGDGWGDFGFFWATQAVVEDMRSVNFYAIHADHDTSRPKAVAA